ncbi:glycoside hydrolase family 27 protein [Actinoplanes subtropicus]|uniref:glycoside hydrolase family 27 protein n=1 Tax=Actinoplanes subtropicus TaxID=543632 RepID=UPI0004C43D83|nr:ricin-type beta-trefoil lectin domain protein [Actinoplanes subtropicus]
MIRGNLLVRPWRAALALAVGVASAPLFALALAQPAHALNNSLALTPQMGFNDWNAYGCNVSESLIKATALAMHNNGMQAAGYQYVNIDDCWLTHSRDSSGHLVPDPAKFPDGISGTAAYVHSLGLKLGIYEDAGTMTCAGYPGSLGHETTDANSFASWGVDYLKYDNCYSDGVNQTSNGGPSAQSRYTTMRDALAATGRPILFSLCDWGFQSPWTWGAAVGNSWRTTGDINASFGSMLSIFHSNVGLASYAGPGAWNDPDMLEIGNGMTTTEQQSEFSLWSEMAAPLIAGTNIANASGTTLSILTNKNVIAVDQDSLGKQGTEVSSSGGLDVLAKPLANGDVSVALFNENSGTATITTTVGAIGKSGASSYTLTDLWSGATSTTTNTISASVPGHGTVMLRVAGGTTGGGGSATGAVHSVGAGKCLDVPNSSTTGGTQLDIHACSGAANQTFTHTTGNQLSVYSGGSQMCLDANGKGTTAGTKVIIWSCNGQTNQQWLFNSNGTVTGAQSGLCLDVAGASTADGALVELWTCNGGSNQQWTIG